MNALCLHTPTLSIYIYIKSGSTCIGHDISAASQNVDLAQVFYDFTLISQLVTSETSENRD